MQNIYILVHISLIDHNLASGHYFDVYEHVFVQISENVQSLASESFEMPDGQSLASEHNFESSREIFFGPNM